MKPKMNKLKQGYLKEDFFMISYNFCYMQLRFKDANYFAEENMIEGCL